MIATAPATSNVVHGTIMFTDIVGFTEFNALRGDEEALKMLSLQDSIVNEELDSESRIVKTLGDGLMLWFAEACVAVKTGMRLQERFEEESWNTDMPLWVRIGLHYGQQIRRGDDLLGHDVNVASRILDFADSGEVLASEAAVKSANCELDDIVFAQIGPVVMKGIPTPINLYRVERVDA